jgi:prophage regulatory protein
MSESAQKLLRLKDVLKLIPVSRATWYAGCATGRFPQKVKLGPRIVAWRSEDIQKLIDEGWSA